MKKFFYLLNKKKSFTLFALCAFIHNNTFFLLLTTAVTPSGMVNEKISLSLFDTIELQTKTNTRKRKERKKIQQEMKQ